MDQGHPAGGCSLRFPHIWGAIWETRDLNIVRMTNEALRLQLDNLHVENQELESENAQLQVENLETAVLADLRQSETAIRRRANKKRGRVTR